MSERIKNIVESIMASKPVDVARIFEESMAERIASRLPEVMTVLGESVVAEAFDPEEDEDEITEIDFDEMSDEDFAEILNQMSDDEFDDLISEIDGLEESELQEISKGRLVNYIGAASADKSHHAHQTGKINQKAATSGTSASDREDRDHHNELHGKRSGGIQQAAWKLAGMTKVKAK